MSWITPLKYEELKDIYKVKDKSNSLFDYLLTNNEFNPNRLFHKLSKEELVDEYEKLSKEHLELLKSL